jgi:hypothetical protein
MVKFDRAMMDYRLSSEQGVVLPDVVAVSAVERIRVMELGESGVKDKNTFDAPSNVIFIPAEYWAVNCCPEDELICEEGECVPCNPQQTFCEQCCAYQALLCEEALANCNSAVTSQYVEDLLNCATGVCAIYGIDSEQCRACLLAANAQLAVGIIVCQVNFNYCMDTRAYYCPGCPPCP